jgi:hypothetical protein
VTGHCGGVNPSQKKEETTSSLHSGTVGAPATFESSVLMRLEEEESELARYGGAVHEGDHRPLSSLLGSG